MTKISRHSLRFVAGMAFGIVASTGVGLSACNSSPVPPELQTANQALRPRALKKVLKSPAQLALETAQPVSEFCHHVEETTRRTAEAMPAQLDADTLALGAQASGCDIVLRYGLPTIAAAEVAPTGMAAMRRQVIAQLCSERPARRVMEHEGSFTSVYEDKIGQAIGQFQVSLSDCLAANIAKPLPVKS